MKTAALAFAAFLGAAGPAFGADFSAQLVDLDGKPIHETPDGGPTLTLGRAAAGALVVVRDQQTSGLEQARNYALATKLYGGGNVELTAEETKRVEDAVAKAYAPLVSGQVWKLLDPASVK